MVRRLDIGAEAPAPVIGNGVIDRNAAVFRALLPGGSRIAPVQPGDVDLAAFVDAQRIETVGDGIEVVVDRDRRGKTPAAVQRAAEADIARKRRFQRPGIGNVDIAVAGHQDFRAVLAVRRDKFRLPVHPDRRAIGFAPVVRMAHHDMPVLHGCQPQPAPRVEGGRGGKRLAGERCLPHLRHVVGRPGRRHGGGLRPSLSQQETAGKIACSSSRLYHRPDAPTTHFHAFWMPR